MGRFSGFAGGKTDAIMMRIVDTLLAIPFLVLVIVLQANLERLVGGGDQVDRRSLRVGQGIHRPPDQRRPPVFRPRTAWLAHSFPNRAGPCNEHQGAAEFVEEAVALGYGKVRILFRP